MQIMNKSSLKSLVSLFQKIDQLQSINAVLQWDRETYMPLLGWQSRGNSIEKVEKLIDTVYRSKSMKKHLGILEKMIGKHHNFTQKEMRIIEEAKEDHREQVGIPYKLKKEIIAVENQSLSSWKEARESNDISLFLPVFDKLTTLYKRKAEALKEECSCYDTLLHAYDRSMSTSTLSPLFKEIEERIHSTQQQYPAKDITTPQIQCHPDINHIVKDIVHMLAGQHRDKINISPTIHPFCSKIDYSDVRITYNDKTDIFNTTSAVLHEFGHALYDLQIDPMMPGTALSKACSYSIHESQSLFWEYYIGTNPIFVDLLYDNVFSKYHMSFDKNAWKNMQFKYINSHSRLKTDFSTYPLHIILRFKIEDAIFNKNANPMDLPFMWNELQRDMLGMEATDDVKSGCLQDVHWAAGLFGYFPTYLLGHIYAAQINSSITSSINLDSVIKSGNFDSIMSWLKNSVHLHGKLYSSKDLMEKIYDNKDKAGPFLERIALFCKKASE